MKDERLRQFTRFLAVGVTNTTISFVVYRLLLAVGVWYVAAAPVAFAVGALNGYVLNRGWTFAARDTARARLLYVVVQGTGALATRPLLHAAGASKVVAYLAAIPPVTLATVIANRLWTFTEKNEATERKRRARPG